jgi:hypothetical protein
VLLMMMLRMPNTEQVDFKLTCVLERDEGRGVIPLVLAQEARVPGNHSWLLGCDEFRLTLCKSVDTKFNRPRH